MSWESVIGLEIHAQLRTTSKIFSGASTAYGAAPNTQACAVDLGLPGVLPVLNKEVVRMAILFGLATNCQISKHTIFARKNYFYPDLPKGYQISQYEQPIVFGGHLEIEGPDEAPIRVGITRAHLEEDAGKSIHDAFQGQSGIDLNRAGTPLLEIVSEPDMRNARQAVAYMRRIHTLVRYLGICDGNMQEGSFRCDANVSVRRRGDQKLGTRAEVKNLNSFRFVERAINFEIGRQIDLLESGKSVIQETRLYDSAANSTRTMRDKEEANDYRYFPDPDLLPVSIEQSFVDELRTALPELPDAKRHRFVEQFAIRDEDAAVITESPDLANYFEHAVSAAHASTNKARAKLVANWTLGNLLGALNKAELDITDVPINPTSLGLLVQRIDDGTISGNIAKQVFDIMWSEPESTDPDSIIDAQGLRQLTDSSAIEGLIDEIIASNHTQVEQFRAGKEKVFGFFVGKVMQASKGKADPKQVNEILRRKLSDDG